MPWLVGGGALLLLLLASQGSAAAAAAAQEQMVFKDYMWLTVLPLGSEQVAQQQLPPPPGQAVGSGQWQEYPEGYGAGTITHQNADGTTSRLTIWSPVFPGIPQGLSVYAWIPTKGTLALINGYYVMHTPSWTYKNPQNIWAAIPNGAGPSINLANMPEYHNLGAPTAPPPGQLPGSGDWHTPIPGYEVWLTPQNVNAGTLATQAFNLPNLVAALQSSPYSRPAGQGLAPLQAATPARGASPIAPMNQPGLYTSPQWQQWQAEAAAWENQAATAPGQIPGYPPNLNLSGMASQVPLPPVSSTPVASTPATG